MADNEIKNKIVIEGEAQYKRAMAEINNALRENKSSVKAASAEYEAQGKSSQALRERLASLNALHETQTRALDTMREQLVRVTDAYGDNSREATTLRTKINNMRTEIAGTSTQLSQLTDRLQSAADAGRDSEDGVSGTAKALAEIGQGAGEAESSAGGLSGMLDSIFGKTGSPIDLTFDVGNAAKFALEVGGKIAGSIKKLVEQGIDEAVDTQKLSNKIGVLTGTAGTASNELLTQLTQALALKMPGYTDEQLAGIVASAWTRLDMTGLEGDMTTVLGVIQTAIAVAEGTGQSFDTILQTANNLKTTFGVDLPTALGLVYEVGTSEAGTSAFETLEKYGGVFESLGMDADDAVKALENAAANGVPKMNEVGDAAEKIAKALSGDKGSVKLLKELGLEGYDLGWKFQQGGQTAQEAVELLLQKLLEVDDPQKQNEIGEAIFGAKLWKEHGTEICQAVLDSYGTDLEEGLTAKTEAAVKALTDDLDSQLAILEERKNQAMAKAMDRPVSAATGFVTGMNEAFDEGQGLLGAVLNGVSGSIIYEAEQIGDEKMRARGEALRRDVFAYLHESASQGIEAAQEVIDDTAEALANAQSDYIADVTAQLRQDILELNAQMEAAYDNEQFGLYDELGKQFDALLEEYKKAGGDVADLWNDATSAAAETLEAGGEDLKAAGESAGQDAADGMESKASDMETAGQTLGENAVSGLETGLDGLDDAAQSSVDGMLSVLEGAEGDAYAAGAAAGRAYQRGYKTTMEIHSPSRVMRQLAEFTVAPLMDTLEGSAVRVYAAGEGLAAAVADGYGTQTRAIGAMPGGSAAAPRAEDIAQAMREALGGLEWRFDYDGEQLAVHVEPGISRAQHARTAATVAGRGSSMRGW